MVSLHNKSIQEGRCVLGIEFGSTRIKSVLLDENNNIVSSGSKQWENKFEDNVWTYHEEEIWEGFKESYKQIKEDVLNKYGVTITKLGGIGISGMMHGYIALDKDDNWLVPFRTWRNTITSEASKKLSTMFNFHIPQRWTIAHLYQAILNKEEHLSQVSYVTTLAGYIHYKLTGEKFVGIGEASGIFPIDSNTKEYNKKMVEAFNDKTGLSLLDIIPGILPAGKVAGKLTKEGVALLDPSNDLESGILFAPAEGDAGTGMVATNAIKKRTGNVSAGTSVFAMIVLENELSTPYDMIDVVTTPVGDSVAMVHVNNCTSDINAWVELFKDVLDTFGFDVDQDTLYKTLFEKSLKGDSEVGKLLSFNYLSGEHITGFREGRPLLVRQNDSTFNVNNIMKMNLFSSLATLRVGMDVLRGEEIKVDSITGHGGLFKTPYVGQVMLASAINTPITTLASASEGGPYGMALLTNYMVHSKEWLSLSKYLNVNVFDKMEKVEVKPDKDLVKEFNSYMRKYVQALPVEQAAINYTK